MKISIIDWLFSRLAPWRLCMVPGPPPAAWLGGGWPGKDGSRMSDVGCLTSDPGKDGCRMSDVGCLTSDPGKDGSRMSDVGCLTSDPVPVKLTGRDFRPELREVPRGGESLDKVFSRWRRVCRDEESGQGSGVSGQTDSCLLNPDSSSVVPEREVLRLRNLLRATEGWLEVERGVSLRLRAELEVERLAREEMIGA